MKCAVIELCMLGSSDSSKRHSAIFLLCGTWYSERSLRGIVLFSIYIFHSIYYGLQL